MITNTNTSKAIQMLYLKEYFTNYFTQRGFAQIKESFTGGLEVILGLVSGQERKLNIMENENESILYGKQTRQIKQNKQTNEIQQINESFENLYHRLNNIFIFYANKMNQIKQMRQNYQSTSIPSETHRSSSINIQRSNNKDEQLYEMLNEYKTENKRLKEVRKKLENQCSNQRNEINTLKASIDEQNYSCNEKQLTIQEHIEEINILKDKIQEMKGIIYSLKAQIGDLVKQNHKIQELTSVIQKIKQEKNEINMKLIEQIQINKENSAKINSFDAIIAKKIKEKESFIHSVVEQKLKDQKLCVNVMNKQFMKYMKITQRLRS